MISIPSQIPERPTTAPRFRQWQRMQEAAQPPLRSQNVSFGPGTREVFISEMAILSRREGEECCPEIEGCPNPNLISARAASSNSGVRLHALISATLWA